MTLIIKSIIAGMILGFGVYSNTIIENPIFGALMFSFGLLCIIRFNLELFTGKCGLILESKDGKLDYLLYLLKILVGNLCGIAMMLFMIKLSTPTFDSEKIMLMGLNIINMKWYSLIISSMLCGMLMKIAVKSNNTVIVIFSVMIFVLSGFKHSIAGSFYLFLNTMYVQSLKSLIIMVVGNFIGSLIPIEYSKK